MPVVMLGDLHLASQEACTLAIGDSNEFAHTHTHTHTLPLLRANRADGGARSIDLVESGRDVGNACLSQGSRDAYSRLHAELSRTLTLTGTHAPHVRAHPTHSHTPSKVFRGGEDRW